MAMHVKFGGSTAARDLKCSRWHELSEGVPRIESPAMLTGTALHTIIEKTLLDVDLDPYLFSGQIVDGVAIDDDLIESKIYPAIDDFETLMDRFDIVEYFCEVWGSVTLDVGGTTDFAGLSSDGTTLVIADYKSGDGVLVDAQDNAQGLFYAMCLLALPTWQDYLKKVTKVVIAIVQPSDRRAETLDVWETTRERVNEFAIVHAEAVALSKSGKGVAVAGSHCTFCPAEVFCPAKKELLAKSRGLPIGSLKAKQLADAMAIVEDVEAWAKAVRRMAHDNIEKGTPVKGFKLVAKRAIRCWNDAPAVDAQLKNLNLSYDETYTKKMRSPAQIETLCKGYGIDFTAEFGDLVSAISSGTTLVSVEDTRAAVQLSPARKLMAARFG